MNNASRTQVLSAVCSRSLGSIAACACLLNTDAEVRLDGSWRFAKRHKERAMIFSTSRSNSREFD